MICLRHIDVKLALQVAQHPPVAKAQPWKRTLQQLKDELNPMLRKKKVTVKVSCMKDMNTSDNLLVHPEQEEQTWESNLLSAIQLQQRGQILLI